MLSAKSLLGMERNTEPPPAPPTVSFPVPMMMLFTQELRKNFTTVSAASVTITESALPEAPLPTMVQLVKEEDCTVRDASMGSTIVTPECK